MKPSPWVFILFSLVMGIVIMIFPYLITVFNRFNKERLLIWRKFLIILFVCYIPFIAILYAGYIASLWDIGPKILQPWCIVGYYLWIGYYFGYIALTIFAKKRINLQLGWFKFIISATVGYLLTTILLVYISILFHDPLITLFAAVSVNYALSP